MYRVYIIVLTVKNKETEAFIYAIQTMGEFRREEKIGLRNGAFAERLAAGWLQWQAASAARAGSGCKGHEGDQARYAGFL